MGFYNVSTVLTLPFLISSLTSSSSSSEAHFIFIALLKFVFGSISVQVMIDFGATFNFISKAMVDVYRILVSPHKTSIPLTVIDGTSISSGSVTQYISSISLGFDIGHQEQLQLHVIPIPSY